MSTGDLLFSNTVRRGHLRDSSVSARRRAHVTRFAQQVGVYLPRRKYSDAQTEVRVRGCARDRRVGGLFCGAPGRTRQFSVRKDERARRVRAGRSAIIHRVKWQTSAAYTVHTTTTITTTTTTRHSPCTPLYSRTKVGRVNNSSKLGGVELTRNDKKKLKTER